MRARCSGSELDSGIRSIFTGLDPVKDKLIGVGDSLFNSTVTDIALGSEGLNNAGQVSFLCLTGNGTYGIYRANPTFVPERRSITGALGAVTLMMVGC